MKAPANELAPPTLGQRLRGSFRHTGQTTALVWRSSPAGTIALVLLTVAAAALNPASAMLGKLIIDSVVAARSPVGAGMSRVMRFVLLELGAVAGLALVDRSLGLVRMLVGARLTVDVNVRILEKALTLDLHHFENPEFYDKLTRARKEAGSRPLSLVGEHLGMLRAGLALAGYLALLTRFSVWVMAAVLLSGVPSFLAEARFSIRAHRLRNWRSPEARRLGYLEHVLAEEKHVKELKLFRLGPLLLERYKRLAETFYREDSGLARRRAGWGYALSLLSTLTFYGCYVLIATRTAHGQLSLGDMTLYLVAFRQASGSFQGLLGALGGMYEHNLYMSDLFDYLNIPTTPATGTPAAVATSASGEGLQFEHVGYKYPDAESWALQDLDFRIPHGQSLALVGENGAGKTTLIKLLTRLYQPTAGRILLDGRDLRQWDLDDLRRRIAVIFQDFNQYQFSVRENVGVGSVEHLDDELRVKRAVEQGGAREVVSRLANGLDTQLGRRFKGGTELSGGQWQKVALARAFMREEADILVLDEPTAALDARAEHAVFERFRTLTRGRTTILISHRFPTVRMADRILVLEGGRIIEAGSHTELLQAGARYAQLFDLQARGYR
jgi:ATP-binding cassette subfamily B protein